MLSDHVSTDEMQGMLLLKKAEIEQMLRVELQRVQKIEARLHAIHSMENESPLDVVIKQVPAQTAESDALSKDLKKRGFRFVGSTIMYAHMQATGLVNDHVVGCFRHAECARQR